MSILYTGPIVNLFSHSVGRLLTRSSSFRNSRLGRKLSEVGERVMYHSLKAGMDGKKISEARLAAAGTLSPGLSNIIGAAHEAGVQARVFGVRTPEDLASSVLKIKNKMDNIRKTLKTAKKTLPYASAAAPAALGGLVGAASTPGDGDKLKRTLVGAAAGAGSGLLGYKILSKKISNKIKSMAIDKKQMGELYSNVNKLADTFIGMGKGKRGLVEKITDKLFVS